MGEGRNETRDGGKRERKKESIYTVPYKNAISADGILRELLASPYLFSLPSAFTPTRSIFRLRRRANS